MPPRHRRRVEAVVATTETTGAPSAGGPPDPSDDDWGALAVAWAPVRARAMRLRALADELDAQADHWAAIIAERRVRLD